MYFKYIELSLMDAGSGLIYIQMLTQSYSDLYPYTLIWQKRERKKEEN